MEEEGKGRRELRAGINVLFAALLFVSLVFFLFLFFELSSSSSLSTVANYLKDILLSA